MKGTKECGRVIATGRWRHFVTAEGCHVSECVTDRGPLVVLRAERARPVRLERAVGRP